MHRVGVIIPSRLGYSDASRPGGRKLLVESAIRSIRAQNTKRPVEFAVYIGVDKGTPVPVEFPEQKGITIVESEGKSQAAALNAAAQCVDADLVGILEDDDEWDPHFLETSLEALSHCDFTSSTQLEFSVSGVVRRINDFPTPSGWLMSRKTFDDVGLFNESYRWHLDNEWLGRLAQSGARRLHLVEATAPTDLQLAAQVRPWLAKCIKNGGSRIRLARHSKLRPLVNRLVHESSGTGQIAANADLRAQSETEYQSLVRNFGRIPW